MTIRGWCRLGLLIALLCNGHMFAIANQSTENGLSVVKRGASSEAVGDEYRLFQQIAERYSRVQPDDVDKQFLRVIAYIKLGQLSEATSVLNALAKLHDAPEIHNNIAVIYFQQGKYAEAERALKQAINTPFSIAMAYENLGDLYLTLSEQRYRESMVFSKGANAKIRVRSEGVRSILGLDNDIRQTAHGMRFSKTLGRVKFQELEAMLRLWAASLAIEDAKVYGEFYDDGLTSSLRSRGAKGGQRNLKNLRVEMLTSRLALVVFRQQPQRGEAARGSDGAVVLVNRNNEWKIQKEFFL
ncbi:MAG: tetratricopeptide repeat protein [Methylotenera sp.]|nr:tetratricopeptide repeat protein [Methylotenera sp.]